MISIFSKINIPVLLLLTASLISLNGCSKTELDPNRPIQAEDKRQKNINEGRGASISSIIGNRGSTNYEFSSSNPMWRASLETLDFLPLTTVDYSGGVIITDWYSENAEKESIKITIRFLSNEIRSDSLKIIVHKKVCNQNLVCTTTLSTGRLIQDELRSTILKKASLFQKADKNKK
jgi:hypothetical protein